MNNSLGLARLTASEERMKSLLLFSAFPGYGGQLGLAASLRGVCSYLGKKVRPKSKARRKPWGYRTAPI